VVKAGGSPADDPTTIIGFLLSAHVDLPHGRPSIPECWTIVHIMCTDVNRTRFGHFVRSGAVLLGRIPLPIVTGIVQAPTTGGESASWNFADFPKLYLSFGVYH
jgi:hypothetical protein